MADRRPDYRARWIEARFAGRCAACGGPIWRGMAILYTPRGRCAECHACGNASLEPSDRPLSRANGDVRVPGLGSTER